MKVAFDFTIYEEDGETPLFGSLMSGELESDFQTPDPDLPHDRPYLKVPANFTGAQIDFLNGSSSIGAVSVGVMDRRQDADDQASGLLTSRIADTKGRRAVLREWDEDAAVWLPVFEGLVHTYSVDPEELLVYWFHLRDGREFERAQPLFRSNYVIFGELFTEKGKTFSKHGPLIDYGALPGGGHMINAIGPWESIAAGEISHFHRGAPMTWLGREIFWGLTPGINEVPVFNLMPFWASTPADDGLYYFEDFWIRWRAKGSYDAWTELRNMPRAFPNYAAHGPNFDIPAYSEGDVAAFEYFTTPTLYFGSFDEADLPEEGEEIEFQIMASRITDESPFWWDGGTLGDLLQEIVNGEHTDEPPRERYDAAELAAFALSTVPARFILKAPVTDRRKWVEENIYKPAMVAPAFNDQLEIRPVSWLRPDSDTVVPLIDPDTIEPVGDWQDGISNAVGQVQYRYVREHLEDQRKVSERQAKKAFGFIPYGHKMVEVLDVTQMEWERLVEDEVVVEQAASSTLPGAKPVTFAPVTIRTITDVYGRSQDVGDSRELGAAFLVARTIAEVFDLYALGAPTYEALVTATPANRTLLAGQLVRVHSEYLPDYGSARRGTGRFMRIVSISVESPAQRRALLIDTGVPDPAYVAEGSAEAEDCLSGGTVHPATDGKVIRLFTADGFLENTCDHAVDVELVIIAGGGGGGTAAGGGGGGAGGVLGVSAPRTVSIGPGEIVPIVVGDGGATGVSGDDSIVWIDPDTGLALDPGTDPAPEDFQAIGGGYGGGSGVGADGGSGGGSGKNLPGSGGGTQTGTSGTAGQGNGGGGSANAGGLATCQAAAGGGGGSFGGAGLDGVASTDPEVGSEPGRGGPSYSIDGWGITTGGGGGGGAFDQNAALPPAVCSNQTVLGADGDAGFGAGGAGGANGAGGPGRSGVVAVRYEGGQASLQPPAISSAETSDQNQATICIDETDWPPGAVVGYRVRVEYAVNATEPAATSGLWKLAGYLDAPGCVTTPPVPTGAKVWSRAVAQASGYLPSPPGTATSQDTPETPGLLALAITLDENGVPTVSWTPNAFADRVVIQGLQHAEGDDTTPPLDELADLDASDLGYVLPFTLAQGELVTVDVEAYLGYELGRTYRASVQNPVREIITASDGIDALVDVELTAAAPDDLLQLDDYGVWVNRAPLEALGDIRLDQWAEPEDNTDLDADENRHGLLQKYPNDGSKFLRGDKVWAVPGSGGGGWDAEIIAASDQDVTNNATLQNDSELVIAGALIDEVYDVELVLMYAGIDTAVDFKLGWSLPTAVGFHQIRGVGTPGDVVINQIDRLTNATTFSVALGTISGQDACVAVVRMMLTARANGSIQFQFANNTAGSGQWSRRMAGTVLKYRQLK